MGVFGRIREGLSRTKQQIVERFEDLVRTAYAAYVIELLDRFTYEEGENRALYQLLVETLERVSTLPDPPPDQDTSPFPRQPLRPLRGHSCYGAGGHGLARRRQSA